MPPFASGAADIACLTAHTVERARVIQNLVSEDGMLRYDDQQGRSKTSCFRVLGAHA